MERFHRMKSSTWTRMILGVLIISVGITLPIVGFVVTALVVIVGAGALVDGAAVATGARAFDRVAIRSG